MQSYDYRSQARWALKGKWKAMIGVMLLAQIVLSGFGLADIVQNFFSEQRLIDGAVAGMDGYQLAYHVPNTTGWMLAGIGQLIALLGNVVYIGLYRACAVVLQGGWPSWQQLFPMKLFFKALWMNILRGLLIFAQLLLLVIPGIIALYRYSMADYLLAENPELGALEALRLSGERLRGHKGRLFALHFSFIGWALLASLVPMGAVMLLIGMPAWLLAAVEIIAAWLCSCLLDIYVFMSETAFFADLLHGSAKRSWHEARREAWQHVPPETEAEESAEPAPEPVQSRADETAARELFLAHSCSVEKLRSAGRMEEYEELNPSRMGEEKWKKDYADALMRRFDRDPGALDDLLALSAEYALDDLADRMLQRISRHIRQASLSPEQVLAMLGRVLAMLTSGAFALNEGFVGRKKAEIAAMADTLEALLQAENPDGEWIKSMEMLRQMCR